jgi:hypothetical protein
VRVQAVPGIAMERLQAQRKVEQLFGMRGANLIVFPRTLWVNVPEGNSLAITIAFVPLSA